MSGNISFSDVTTVPRPFVSVYLYKQGDYSKFNSSTTSDTNGNYLFSGFNPGIYDLRLVSGMYRETSVSYLTLLSGKDITSRNFIMTKSAGNLLLTYETAEQNGKWTKSGDYLYTTITGNNTVTWRLSLPEYGSYEVYVIWTPGGNRASDVPYEIYHKDGMTEVKVNQQTGGKFKLGQFEFVETSSNAVVVTNRFTTPSNGAVIAEKLELVPTVQKPPPSVPIGFSLVQEDKQIKLSWQPPATGTINYYNIYRSTSAGVAKSNADLGFMPVELYWPPTNLTWTDTKTIPNVWYYYSITAVNTEYIPGAGTYEQSDIISVPAQVNVEIYPNRISTTDSKVTLKSTVYGLDNIDLTVKVYTVTGELVSTLAGNKRIIQNVTDTVTWDGRNDSGELVANGVYLVHVFAGSVSELKKVIVLRQ